MEEYLPYDRAAARRAARRDYFLWLFASLLVSLLPFVVVGGAYRLFHAAHGSHVFPWSSLLGRGELLLVVLSVTGATAGEMIFNPGHLNNNGKRLMLMITFFIGTAAIGLFTVTAYCQLAHAKLAIDRPTTMLVSLVLLSLVILNQTLTVFTRPFVTERVQ